MIGRGSSAQWPRCCRYGSRGPAAALVSAVPLPSCSEVGGWH
ncbi:hypothetical protein AB0B54_34505 [Microbispora bryophytorum]